MKIDGTQIQNKRGKIAQSTMSRNLVLENCGSLEEHDKIHHHNTK